MAGTNPFAQPLQQQNQNANSSGFTPQQQQAIQQSAAQATSGVTNPTGETVGGIDNSFVNSLQNSGLFDANQLGAIQQSDQFDPHGSSFLEQGKSAQPFSQALINSVNSGYQGAENNIQKAGGTGLQAIYPSSQQLQQFAPKPWNDFGPTPQVAAQSMQAPANVTGGGPEQAAQVGQFQQAQGAQVGPYQQAQGAGVDNVQLQGAYNQEAGQLQAAMAPYNQQQQQAQNESMAARGLTNTGAAAQADTQLAAYQNANLNQQLGQFTSNLQSQYGQGVLQTSAQRQQAGLLNAENSYGAATTNAANAQQAGLQNSQQSYGAATSNAANQQTAYNNAYNQGYEAQVQNQNTAYNTNQYNATAANDANVYNANQAYNVTNNNWQANNLFNNELYNSQMQESQTAADHWLNTFQPNNAVTSAIGAENAAAGPYGQNTGAEFSNL